MVDAPKIIAEPTVAEIVAELCDSHAGNLPGWVRSDADPIMKTIYSFAQREAQLRRRINEAGLCVMPAYAKGAYLDEMIKWMGEERLNKANASYSVAVTVSAPLTVPAGYVLRNTAGTVAGKTLAETVFAGAGTQSIVCEVTDPEGALGNGLTGITTPATPLAGIESISQADPAADGMDDESDEACFGRFQLAWAKKTGAGPGGQYRFYAKGADPRIAEVRVMSPDPGYISVYLLSSIGDGTADAAMIERVETALSPEDIRPMGDVVTVLSAAIIAKKLRGTVYLAPGVEQSVFTQVESAAALIPAAHRTFGCDITESRLTGLCYAQGVSKMTWELYDTGTSAWVPFTDITIAPQQVAHIESISMLFGGFHE